MGGRGAYGKVRVLSDDEIEELEWQIVISKDLKQSRLEVKERLLGKEIHTEKFDEHCTGLIKLNSNGLNDVLCNRHSPSSERKWALERLYRKKLRLSYAGYEDLDPNSHNLAKKIEKGFTGFNKYSFSFRGNNFELKTAIIKGKYETPYYIYKR